MRPSKKTIYPIASIMLVGHLISCSHSRPEKTSAPQTLSTRHIEVHGHRGSRARLPENTLPAFQLAMEGGVDALEMDMGVTRDGVIVISHDPHISPIICASPTGIPLTQETAPLIHNLTLKQVKSYDCGSLRNPRFPTQNPVPGTRIPTLEEVFLLTEKSSSPFAKTVRFNIETKIFPDHPEYTVDAETFVKKFLKIVKKHKMLSRVILQSFDHRTLKIARKLEANIITAALFDLESPWLNGDPVDAAVHAGANILSPDARLVSPFMVQRSHNLRIQVLPWTVNEEKYWDSLISLGVDGIITDDPLRLLKHLGRIGR